MSTRGVIATTWAYTEKDRERERERVADPTGSEPVTRPYQDRIQFRLALVTIHHGFRFLVSENLQHPRSFPDSCAPARYRVSFHVYTTTSSSTIHQPAIRVERIRTSANSKRHAEKSRAILRATRRYIDKISLARENDPKETNIYSKLLIEELLHRV